MFVRMLTSISGHADPRYKLEDFSFRPGDTPNLHKTLAKAWIDSGIAESAKGPDVEPVEAEASEPNQETV